MDGLSVTVIHIFKINEIKFNETTTSATTSHKPMLALVSLQLASNPLTTNSYELEDRSKHNQPSRLFWVLSPTRVF